MKIYSIILTLGLFSAAQNLAAQQDERAVKAVINRFFEGLEKGDTSLLKSTCTDNPVLQTYMADKSGALVIMTEDYTDLLNFVGTPKKDSYDERIKFKAVLVEKSLASVWTPYVFYLNGKISHCGTNSFQLVKTSQGWKIQYIIDTRRKQGCNSE
ncbi:MAG: hypothetical protein JNJ57_05935 [Saprospiraceae bacterium]|nr:hypothetical protein [Saprospiraceae bacterium]